MIPTLSCDIETAAVHLVINSHFILFTVPTGSYIGKVSGSPSNCILFNIGGTFTRYVHLSRGLPISGYRIRTLLIVCGYFI